MPSIDLTTRPSRPRLRIPLVVMALLVVLLGAAIFAVVSQAIRTPTLVSRVTFVNDTPYALEVDVREHAGAGRVLLGRALPEGSTLRHEVTDVGERWLFTFNRGGVLAGELDVSREELDRDDWRVTIPDSIVAPLRDAGVTPYPDEGRR
jgi:hypothetical protein